MHFLKLFCFIVQTVHCPTKTRPKFWKSHIVFLVAVGISPFWKLPSWSGFEDSMVKIRIPSGGKYILPIVDVLYSFFNFSNLFYCSPKKIPKIYFKFALSLIINLLDHLQVLVHAVTVGKHSKNLVHFPQIALFCWSEGCDLRRSCQNKSWIFVYAEESCGGKFKLGKKFQLCM